MLDELENVMQTTEFLSASPQIQKAFTDRWQAHANFLQQRAQAQQESMNNSMIHSAVANATQQTAAKVASEVVDVTLRQMAAQGGRAQQAPTPADMLALSGGQPNG